jgi:hypothetical protein
MGDDGRVLKPNPPPSEMEIGGWVVFVAGLLAAGYHAANYAIKSEQMVPVGQLAEAVRELNLHALYVLGGSCLAGLAGAAVWYGRGLTLRARVLAMLPAEGIKGHTFRARLGEPAVYENGRDGERATWRAGNYAATFAFDDGVCVEVVGESVGR